LALNIQPPTPLSNRFPGDPIVLQHDQAMQMMYEALLELARRVDALESGS